MLDNPMKVRKPAIRRKRTDRGQRNGLLAGRQVRLGYNMKTPLPGVAVVRNAVFPFAVPSEHIHIRRTHRLRKLDPTASVLRPVASARRDIEGWVAAPDWTVSVPRLPCRRLLDFEPSTGPLLLAVPGSPAPIQGPCQSPVRRERLADQIFRIITAIQIVHYLTIEAAAELLHDTAMRVRGAVYFRPPFWNLPHAGRIGPPVTVVRRKRRSSPSG